MATLFQGAVSTSAELDFKIGVASYRGAMAAVEALLASSPAAVRTIRAEYPDLHVLTPPEFSRLLPGAPPATARMLCGRFVR